MLFDSLDGSCSLLIRNENNPEESICPDDSESFLPSAAACPTIPALRLRSGRG